VGYLSLSCSLVVGATFIVSAVSKLRGRAAYAAFVEATGRLLPAWAARRAWIVRAVAAAVVFLELATPALLLGAPMIGFAVSATLVATFCVAVSAALRRGVRASCACFGASSRRLTLATAARSGLLAVVAVVGLTASSANGSTTVIGGLQAPGVVAAVTAAAVVLAAVLFFEDMADLFTP
jgi:hypothetical protein